MPAPLAKVPGLTPIADHAQGYPQSLLVTPEVIGHIGEGTTEQFRSSSEVYDQRYFQIDGRTQMLQRALGVFPEFKAESVESVLDIGCGSGNVTFPALDLFPGATVYATDISPDMVAILARRADAWKKSDRIVAFVSDAERVELLPESFDLILGSSMVHHLLEPGLFIDRILRTLKPGGLCIFAEPFKAGHQIMRLFLSEMTTLEELRRGIPDDIQKFFKDFIFTIDALSTLDRTKLDYAKLDDKWIFSRAFFAECAERNNTRLGFFTTNITTDRFRVNIERLVWLGLGREWSIPEPARSFVKRFDDALPLDVMDEFSSEACVIFRKDD